MAHMGFVARRMLKIHNFSKHSLKKSIFGFVFSILSSLLSNTRDFCSIFVFKRIIFEGITNEVVVVKTPRILRGR